MPHYHKDKLQSRIIKFVQMDFQSTQNCLNCCIETRNCAKWFWPTKIICDRCLSAEILITPRFTSAINKSSHRTEILIDFTHLWNPSTRASEQIAHVQEKRPELKAKATWHLTRGLCRSQICKNSVPLDHGFGTTVSLEVRAHPESVRSRQNRHREFVTDCMVRSCPCSYCSLNVPLVCGRSKSTWG